MPRRAAALHRRITAWHEAAHAVFAFRFGIRVNEVVLCGAGPLFGYVHVLSPPLIEDHDYWQDRPSEVTMRQLTLDTEQHALVYLAGPLVEAKLFGTFLRSHSCESDLAKCYRLCRLLDAYHRHLDAAYGLRVTREAPGERASRLRLRTRRVLGHPRTWRAIKALADDLYAWSRLTGHDAADTVQWTRRIQNQLTLLLPIPSRPGIKPRPRQGPLRAIRGVERPTR